VASISGHDAELKTGMVRWRVSQRLWEAGIALAQGAPNPAQVHLWVQQENQADEEGKYDTFHHDQEDICVMASSAEPGKALGDSD
jgi:hypothetical protein